VDACHDIDFRDNFANQRTHTAKAETLMPKKIDSRLPLLILALTLVVMYYRLLLGEVFFWGLPSLQFYPWREYGFSLLRQGQLPLWNPFNGAGAPLFANYQSALLYPFNWLGYFLPLAQTMSITAVLHLFIAGWGMWRLTGALGANGFGRGVSAVAFGMTNYLVARLGTFPIINAAAWLPWMVWAVHDVMSTGNRRAGAWLALLSALQLLAGHAQTTWYSMGIVGTFVLWYTLSHRPVRWLRLGAVVGCIALGAGVAGLQLAGTAELLGQSQRSGGVDYWTAMNFSYGPARTLNFLSPIIFGTPADGSFLTQGAYFEDAVYIGLIPLVAAIVPVIGWRRRRRSDPLARYVPFFVLIVAAGYVLALGQYSPIFPFLYEHVPTFDLFQAPARWHLCTVFGLSILAGIGATWWRRGGRWTRPMTVACAGAALVTFSMMLFMLSDNRGVTVLVRALLLTAIFGALAGWLTLRKPETDSPRYGRWALLVFVVIAVDLGIASWGLNPTVSAEFYDPVPFSHDDGMRVYWTREAEQTTKFVEVFRFDDYRTAIEQWEAVRERRLPNLNLIDRIMYLNNFDPLLVEHHRRYVDLVEATERNVSLFEAAGVNGAYRPPYSVLMPFEHVETRRTAWLVGDVCWHEQERDLIDAISAPDWHPFRVIHILGDAGCPEVDPDGDLAGVILEYVDGNNELRIHAYRDGWLYVAETDYPGWIATVDGEPTPIYRANLAFRAVQVSRGNHTVRFDYRPAWLASGALVSTVSLILLLLLFRLKNVTTPYNQSDDVTKGKQYP
jgi:hypothetical protein